MFGLSFTHLVLLAIIILIFLGPEQLPEVARTIARLLNEWKRATSDIQSTLTQSLNEEMHRPPPPNPPAAELKPQQEQEPPTPVAEDKKHE